MISLPDVNVLLALAWSNHVHHEAAHRWFAAESALGWATCLPTQSGFVRLSLNPQVVGTQLSAEAVLALLDALVAHPQHQYFADHPALIAPTFKTIGTMIRGYRQASDAVLLHLARHHGAKLVTFDQAVRTICPWSENLAVITNSST